MTRTHDYFFTWPNILTLVRISVIPLIALIFYLPFKWAHLMAATLFALASITDWLDGYLARYLVQSTKLGAFLDPVADKLMVSVALVLIVAEPVFQFVSTTPAVVTIPAAVIVAREIIVSALREWMAEIGKRAKVTVSRLGKIKTSIQMTALVTLLYCNNDTATPVIIGGYILLYVAAVLTIWSMLIYLKAAWAQLTSPS
ncbi:MAG: CDP-diacylglycerol--glycerol-3-phosphate 3-phosphatidyltransferase [Gammaproteobacteria bacterium RIFCSPHIGHO2_12_FULL_45_12]|nr:MAG: CDP-diacylglycerol--glycerol-3-phosphate 3-phosphatidyltransferase [Gammaproteobacteria bacterium RIFCSPHIGHO2_12_FULL_45_12]